MYKRLGFFHEGFTSQDAQIAQDVQKAIFPRSIFSSEIFCTHALV